MAAKTKILVISNDPVMPAFLTEHLGARGYAIVCTRHTDKEVRSIVARELPELVILDIMMPEMEGLEVCLRIRQWFQVPILMLSAWGVGEGKVRALDLVAESYLTEPFAIEGLEARINQALQRNFAAVNYISPNQVGGVTAAP